MNIALKLAILNAGTTQTLVAGKTGIHESKISQIIRGHREPSDVEKALIARALRKPIAQLFPESQEVA